jgi:hypothetical protein
MSRSCDGKIGGGPDPDPLEEGAVEENVVCPDCGVAHDGYTCQQAADAAQRL